MCQPLCNYVAQMNDSQTRLTHHFSEAFLPLSGISKSQEDAPQLESTEVAKGCGPGAGEVSSASEYFSCVSSPHKLLHGGKGMGLVRCRAPWVHGRRHRGPSMRLRGHPGLAEAIGVQGSRRRSGFCGGAWEDGTAVNRVWIHAHCGRVSPCVTPVWKLASRGRKDLGLRFREERLD